MFREDIYKMKKTNRVCMLFPWDNNKLPQPWPPGYARVMIPLTESEKRNSLKKAHTQIVRVDSLSKIQEIRLRIH
jgi:hypothetical protein